MRMRRLGRALVHRQDLLDLTALLALADANLHLHAGTYNSAARGLQGVGVQEYIAGAVRKLNETESLFGIEPLYRRAQLWRRDSSPEPRETRGGWRVAVKIIIVEATAAWLPLPTLFWRSQVNPSSMTGLNRSQSASATQRDAT
jgi:hypothetical protein